MTQLWLRQRQASGKQWDKIKVFFGRVNYWADVTGAQPTANSREQCERIRQEDRETVRVRGELAAYEVIRG